MTPRTRLSAPSRAACASTVLLLAAMGCGGDGGQVEASAQAPSGGASASPGSGAAAQAEPQMVDLSALGYDEGNETTAAFGVIEFADFGCIHCFAFHRDTYPALHAEFVATGDLLWKYVPVTLAGFPNSELAGASAICAAELGSFVAMRDRLYATSEEWLQSSRGEPLFVEYATALGLNADAFRTCLAGPDARATLESNNAMARRIGVGGTPTFIVGGSPVQGAPPLSNFQAALRQMIAEARAAPTGP